MDIFMCFEFAIKEEIMKLSIYHQTQLPFYINYRILCLIHHQNLLPLLKVHLQNQSLYHNLYILYLEHLPLLYLQNQSLYHNLYILHLEHLPLLYLQNQSLYHSLHILHLEHLPLLIHPQN